MSKLTPSEGFSEKAKNFDKTSKTNNRKKKSSSTVSVISITSSTSGEFEDEREVVVVRDKKSPLSLSSFLTSPKTSTNQFVIFDMCYVPYIDGKAVKTLQEINEELKLKKIDLFLATVSPLVLETLGRCHFFDHFEAKLVFLTLHDAVTFARCHFNNQLTQQPKEFQGLRDENVVNQDVAIFLTV